MPRSYWQLTGVGGACTKLSFPSVFQATGRFIEAVPIFTITVREHYLALRIPYESAVIKHTFSIYINIASRIIDNRYRSQLTLCVK